MTGNVARQLLKVLPDALGYRLLRALTGKTQDVALSPPEVDAMALAKPLRYGPNGRNAAFEWGAGPLVILVHGWSGRAAQMAPLAANLAAQGYRCVALDVTGHGDTTKRFTRFKYFLRDVEALTNSLRSDVHAYVGHSSGGTTLMAARRQGRIKAQRYVCICSPSYPFPSINFAEEGFGPNARVMARYAAHLGDDFGIPWHDLSKGGSFAGAGDDLLLIYDERDRLVPHRDGDRIHALCAGSTLIKTADYGHRRILAAPELPRFVGGFLTREPRGR